MFRSLRVIDSCILSARRPFAYTTSCNIITIIGNLILGLDPPRGVGFMRRVCRVVGHSLIKEINRQRALHIARRLVGTNETLGHIARQVGYDNDAHMARYFQREMGETPRSYRARHQALETKMLVPER